MISFPNTAAVYGIYGSLGGGKTLTAVDIALYFIRHFNYVVTNIRLKNLNPREEKYYLFIDDISKVEWFKVPIGSLRGTPGRKRVAVILDELPELLDQYTSGKDFWVKTFLSWLRMTSKNGQFVFIITQDPSFIMKPVRLLCAYWIRCEDMGEFRLPFFKFRIPFLRDFISRRVYNRDGSPVQGVSLNVARKSVVGRYYSTSQGLSLYSGSVVPNEFEDPFSKYIYRENMYQKYLASTTIFLLLCFAFFVFFFLL